MTAAAAVVDPEASATRSASATAAVKSTTIRNHQRSKPSARLVREPAAASRTRTGACVARVVGAVALATLRTATAARTFRAATRENDAVDLPGRGRSRTLSAPRRADTAAGAAETGTARPLLQAAA